MGEIYKSYSLDGNQNTFRNKGDDFASNTDGLFLFCCVAAIPETDKNYNLMVDDRYLILHIYCQITFKTYLVTGSDEQNNSTIFRIQCHQINY